MTVSLANGATFPYNHQLPGRREMTIGRCGAGGVSLATVRKSVLHGMSSDTETP